MLGLAPRRRAERRRPRPGGPERRVRHHRRADDLLRRPGGHHHQRRARRALPGGGAGRRRRPVHPAGRRVRRHHPGARLHRRHRRAVPVRHHAHPGPDRARDATSTATTGCSARSPSLVLLALLGYSLVDGFGDDKLARRAHDRPARHRRGVATSIFATYLVPFEVVSLLLLAALDRRHRDRPEGLRRPDAAQPVPAARRGPVLHRRLRRHRPHERRAGPHVDRADPQRRQHQPGGVQRHDRRRRPARCSPCSSSRWPPPRWAWASPSCWPSSATARASTSTRST